MPRLTEIAQKSGDTGKLLTDLRNAGKAISASYTFALMLSAFTARPIVELKQRDKSKIEAVLAYGEAVPTRTPVFAEHSFQGTDCS